MISWEEFDEILWKRLDHDIEEELWLNPGCAPDRVYYRQTFCLGFGIPLGSNVFEINSRAKLKVAIERCRFGQDLLTFFADHENFISYAAYFGLTVDDFRRMLEAG